MKREQQQQRSYDRSSWCISINEGPLSSCGSSVALVLSPSLSLSLYLSLAASLSLSELQSSTSCSSAAITKALDSCIICLRFGGGVSAKSSRDSFPSHLPFQPSYLRHVSGISIYPTHLSLSPGESSQDLPPAVAPVANTFFRSLY